VDEPRARPAAALFRLLGQDGALRWSALVLGLAAAAAGAVFEAAIFRGLFDVAAGRGAGLVGRVAAAFAPAGRAGVARVARLALAPAAALLLVPLAAQPALTERDVRMRNHAGALARFYLDALLGLVAIRTHRAEDAMARDHGERLREWLAAARAALRAALAA